MKKKRNWWEYEHSCIPPHKIHAYWVGDPIGSRTCAHCGKSERYILAARLKRKQPVIPTGINGEGI